MASWRDDDEWPLRKRAVELATFTGFELLLAYLHQANRCAQTGCRMCTREAAALEMAVSLKEQVERASKSDRDSPRAAAVNRSG